MFFLDFRDSQPCTLRLFAKTISQNSELRVQTLGLERLSAPRRHTENFRSTPPEREIHGVRQDFMFRQMFTLDQPGRDFRNGIQICVGKELTMQHFAGGDAVRHQVLQDFKIPVLQTHGIYSSSSGHCLRLPKLVSELFLFTKPVEDLNSFAGIGSGKFDHQPWRPD